MPGHGHARGMAVLVDIVVVALWLSVLAPVALAILRALVVLPFLPLPESDLSPCGPCWFRTSDPYRVKVVLYR